MFGGLAQHRHVLVQISETDKFLCKLNYEFYDQLNIITRVTSRFSLRGGKCSNYEIGRGGGSEDYVVHCIQDLLDGIVRK